MPTMYVANFMSKQQFHFTACVVVFADCGWTLFHFPTYCSIVPFSYLLPQHCSILPTYYYSLYLKHLPRKDLSLFNLWECIDILRKHTQTKRSEDHSVKVREHCSRSWLKEGLPYAFRRGWPSPHYMKQESPQPLYRRLPF